MANVLSREVETMILDALNLALEANSYQVKFDKKPTIRIVGVSDGELIMAMECHVLNTGKTDAKDK